MPINNFGNWKTDNYKFVGKAFENALADRMSELLPIIGEVDTTSIDYELTSAGGYGELTAYDGENLNQRSIKRGFKTIIVPGEFTGSVKIGYKQAKVDKFGECKKAGTRLGDSAAMTVLAHTMRLFSNAFSEDHKGGDGVSWASTEHPVASKSSTGRTFVPDEDAGTYSNLITDQLSVAAITKAQSMSRRFVTPDGLPFLCNMDCVLVSPELEATAKKLFGESAALMPKLNPDDETNAANPVYGMSYIVVGGGLDGFSAKQWALCDRRLMKELVNLVYVTRPMVLQNELDNPLIDQYTGYADFGLGWGDARQIIFSNPA